MTLNKQVYASMCILDLSKTMMYDCHCNYVKKKYGCKSKWLFTDTNCFVYESAATYVHEDFYMNKDMFDFSEYPDNSRIYDVKIKKVVGKMKDETKGVHIVGLKFIINWYIIKDIRGKRENN